jgi:putative endonuclease
MDINKKPKHLIAGDWGEDVVCGFLQQKGYKILKRNYVPKKQYEIDIVALHDDVIVFVEVKTRKSVSYGRPAVAVNRKKRAKLQHAIVAYLQKLKKQNPYFRIDIVEVVGEPGLPPLEINHIENAFNLNDRYIY